MKIGLFFGSFNPVHNGHLMIANYMLEFSDLNQIWFVISPQNPFKEKSSLLSDYHRFALLNEAVESNLQNYKVSNIEFSMKKPSYTIDTLALLKEKYSDKEFSVIIGGDNLKTLPKWKNYEEILKQFSVYVYSRPNYDLGELANHEKVTVLNAPLIEISSSFIRKAIKEKKDVRFFMPEKAFNYLEEMHFYEK